MSITTRKNRMKAYLANACFLEREHEDNILSHAVNSEIWSQVAARIRDYRDANGTAHCVGCHRNH